VAIPNEDKMNKKISIEMEGKTINEAIKKALKKIRLPSDRVKIQILQEEKKGLFKMPGAKPAKIRVIQIK